MLADAEILSGLQAMFDAIDVPPVCYDRIVEKIDSAAPRRTFHWQHAALGAAAVMAIAMLAFPSATLAVLEGVVVKGEQAIIKVIGWTPPPRPPAKLASSVRTQISTLGAAQLQVHFTIVPPAGLPSDAKPLGIRTTPVLVYSNVTRSWSKGAPSVWFLYRRSNGDTVTLLADVYDPRTGAPGRSTAARNGRCYRAARRPLRHSRGRASRPPTTAPQRSSRPVAACGGREPG